MSPSGLSDSSTCVWTPAAGHLIEQNQERYISLLSLPARNTFLQTQTPDPCLCTHDWLTLAILRLSDLRTWTETHYHYSWYPITVWVCTNTYIDIHTTIIFIFSGKVPSRSSGWPWTQINCLCLPSSGLEVCATTPGIFIYHLRALHTHTLTDSKDGSAAGALAALPEDPEFPAATLQLTTIYNSNSKKPNDLFCFHRHQAQMVHSHTCRQNIQTQKIILKNGKLK